MFKKIIIHEILLHLVSFRFQLIVGMFIVLFFSGFIVNISDYRNKLISYNEVVATNDPLQVAIPPNPLNPFAQGMDTYSASSTEINLIRGWLVTKPLGNSTRALDISIIKSLDFNFAIKMILSLGAMLISFASVSGERFTGTLKLACAAGASRKHLILAKISASFLCLAIPLLLCIIISCIFLAFNKMLTSQAELIRIVLFVLFSFIYVLFFTLVGLAISIYTQRPQESLMAGVLFWLLFVFILPAVVPQVSRAFVDLPSDNAMQQARIKRFFAAEFDIYLNPNPSSGQNDGPSSEQTPEYLNYDDPLANNPSEDERYLQAKVGDELDWENSRNQFANYVRIKRWFDLVSPYDIFNNASMEIVGNGIQNALHAKQSLLQHRANLLKDKDNSNFAFQRLNLETDFVPAMASMMVLCMEIIILLLFAYRKFMSLDLREG